MEGARTALQNEFEQLVVELETSQSTVEGMETKLQEEEDRREAELARCANVIRELQQQLATAEEHWSNSWEEVNYIIMTSSNEVTYGAKCIVHIIQIPGILS